MSKTVWAIAELLAISAILINTAYADSNRNANSAQPDANLPEGMEIQQIDNNPGFKLVVPKGTTIRKVGDLKVIEGAGEYTARRLEGYDQRLSQIESDIESLRKDIEEIKNTITKIQPSK
jgi:peptidoglycan hydrolase CwlO-like protein